MGGESGYTSEDGASIDTTTMHQGSMIMQEDATRSEIARQNAMLEKQAAAGEIEVLRKALCSYRPGQWAVVAGGCGKFLTPKMTSLLVVGPMGAGKSTLINNLIRVLNELSFGYDRAQVCADAGENGTLFLKEYTLCDKEKNICVYDTRGFSEVDTVEDISMLENWVMNGVRHGQIVQRSSDSQLVNASLRIKARHGHHLLSTRRQVNFVIFAVNGVSICNMMKSNNSRSAADLARLFKSPFLAFKDDRPVVVMTHGDMLSEDDRIDARIYLGELLGVSPVNQIFDIAGNASTEDGNQDAASDLAMLKMLRYAVMRADRNLPYKPSPRMALQLLQLALEGCCDKLGPVRVAVLAVLFMLWLASIALIIPFCLDWF